MGAQGKVKHVLNCRWEVVVGETASRDRRDQGAHFLTNPLTQIVQDLRDLVPTCTHHLMTREESKK